ALDPLIRGHVVEELAERGEAVVERRERRVVELLLEGRRDRLEISGRLLPRVVMAVDPVRVLRAGGLRRDHVDQRQVEPLRQLLDRLVVGVDELAAPLTGLAVLPELTRQHRVHAAADVVRRFEDRAAHAVVLELERGAETRDAGADHRDAGLARRRRRAKKVAWAGQRQPGRRGAGSLQEVAPAHTALALGADSLDRLAGVVGLVDVAGETEDAGHQLASWHSGTPWWCEPLP